MTLQQTDTAVDPKKFGLPARTCLIQDKANRILIVLDRKSRVIMKDAEKILAKAEKIRAVQPGIQIGFQTTAPVCSKSVLFLKEAQIEVEIL